MGKHSAFDMVVESTRRDDSALPPIVGFNDSDSQNNANNNNNNTHSTTSTTHSQSRQMSTTSNTGANAWKNLLSNTTDFEQDQDSYEDEEEYYSDEDRLGAEIKALNEQALENDRKIKQAQLRIQERKRALADLQAQFHFEFPNNPYHNHRYNITYEPNYQDPKRKNKPSGGHINDTEDAQTRTSGRSATKGHGGVLLPGFESPAFKLNSSGGVTHFQTARGHEKDPEEAVKAAKKRIKERKQKQQNDKQYKIQQLIMNQPSSLRSMIVQDLLQTKEFGFPDENDEDDEDDEDEEEEEEEEEEQEEEDEGEFDWKKMTDLESIKREHEKRMEKQKQQLQKQTKRELKRKKKKKKEQQQAFKFQHSASDSQRLSELLDSRKW